VGGPSVTFSKLKSFYLSGEPFELFANCQFPNLISLNSYELKTILDKKWPKLRCLNINFDDLSDLKKFAQSDCCPNLTTLTIMRYYQPTDIDISFLAECPHMPFLSLVRMGSFSIDQSWIVDEGELVPVRNDVVLDDQTPTTSFRISVAF